MKKSKTLTIESLREDIKYNLNVSNIIKEENEEIIIRENRNIDKPKTLKEIRIKNLQNKVWSFDNEVTLKGFETTGKKIEKTFFYLNNDKLYIFLIELKTTITAKILKEIEEKLNNSLTIIPIFLLMNHYKEEYKKLKITPISIIFFNQTAINENMPYQEEVINEFINSEEINNSKKFIIEIKSNSIGNKRIKVKAFQNPNSEGDNFSINFQELIN